GCLAVAALFAPHTARAQTERHTLSGQRVAVYNLAGKLHVEPTTGAQVTVEVTRGGHDASHLRVESGDVRGRPALRVVYPGADRIVYPDMRSSGSTTLTVNSDGTFGDNNGRSWFN